MKIVIDISDEVYNFIINRGHIPYAVNIANVIANGMPLGNDKNCYDKFIGFLKGGNIDREYYCKLIQDIKLIKDAVNDPNKDGFDVCRLIKSITDEYDFEEEEDG